VETPNIVWASSKTAEPPAKLPIITGNPATDENISAFGLTNFRGINHQFGMLRYDRSRHVYIIGQTGAGKSGLLELFALSDIFHGQGYAIIDPHGDFAINNMKFIPGARMDDVVYFNPADTEYPLGFNPLEVTNPAQKTNISSEVIGVLKRMFGLFCKTNSCSIYNRSIRTHVVNVGYFGFRDFHLFSFLRNF
jgi:type IV secretory pathway VirB4 component